MLSLTRSRHDPVELLRNCGFAAACGTLLLRVPRPAVSTKLVCQQAAAASQPQLRRRQPPRDGAAQGREHGAAKNVHRRLDAMARVVCPRTGVLFSRRGIARLAAALRETQKRVFVELP